MHRLPIAFRASKLGVRSLSGSAGSLVQKSMQDGIATIRLANPPANAMSLEVIEQLHAAVKEANGSKEVKGLILTGAPGIFSAGLDIREMHKPDKVRFQKFWGGLQQVFLQLYPSRVPTVAAISGAAPAGGCWLSLLCDHRVMAAGPKSIIGLNETKLGIVAPKWFSTPLVAAVGQRRAERLLQLGLLVPADDALRYGMVDEVVPFEQLSDAAHKALKEYTQIPSAARVKTKLSLRGDLCEWLQGRLEQDTEETFAFMTQPHIQAAIDAYLTSLSKGKKK
jgi:3,2-trans-enoyl-CoA isomerase